MDGAHLWSKLSVILLMCNQRHKQEHYCPYIQPLFDKAACWGLSHRPWVQLMVAPPFSDPLAI